jgi:hypothetical protein
MLLSFVRQNKLPTSAKFIGGKKTNFLIVLSFLKDLPALAIRLLLPSKHSSA